jgi:acyl-CoA synthetase (AMP-forming)/AMP-acid ligase II
VTSPGDAVALVDRRGVWTYAELDARAASIRGALVRRGVRRGDAVLVVTANERESAAAYLAVVGLGAVAVLSHVGAGASELAAACSATTPVLAVLSPPAEARGVDLPDGLAVIPVVELDGAPAPAAPPDPDARRVIVFTSGTTSTPKGVVHSGRSLAAATACFQAMLQLTADDRLFVVSPLGSITGVLQALELAPSVGAAAVLEHDFDDQRSLDLLLDGGGTAYGGPDVVLDRLLSAAERRGVDLPIRIAALGGTMLRTELIEKAERRFGIRVVRVYGSSEAPCSTGSRPDEPDEVRLADEGLPGPGVELRIGDGGELLVRGPHVLLGYVDPADEEGALVDGWFHTGDEASIVDGRLRITGRLKDVASRNGKKISLVEVDLAFAAASGIVGCAAFAVPDDRTGERVAVAVHLPDGATLDVAAVLDAMEGAGLARWKLPESVVRSERPLPVTPTGKVRRQALTEALGMLWRAERLNY